MNKDARKRAMYLGELDWFSDCFCFAPLSRSHLSFSLLHLSFFFVTTYFLLFLSLSLCYCFFLSLFKQLALCYNIGTSLLFIYFQLHIGFPRICRKFAVL